MWEKSEGTGFLDAQSRPLKCHEIVSIFGEEEPYYVPQKTPGKPNHTRKPSPLGGSVIYNGAFTITESDLSGMKYPRSVQRFDIIKPQLRRHPNEKPLDLMQYLVRTYTNPGDTVLDFTSGSGTTLEACKIEGRRAIGIERDTDKDGACLGYCDYAVSRLRQEVLQLW